LINKHLFIICLVLFIVWWGWSNDAGF